jgi:hypothetical protein
MVSNSLTDHRAFDAKCVAPHPHRAQREDIQKLVRQVYATPARIARTAAELRQ